MTRRQRPESIFARAPGFVIASLTQDMSALCRASLKGRRLVFGSEMGGNKPDRLHGAMPMSNFQDLNHVKGMLLCPQPPSMLNACDGVN